jgi:DNA invertase Pin-like site-specific DNA recombinase
VRIRTRAKSELEKFTRQLGFDVAHWFIENESGAKLHRPELFRLLDIAMPGDVLLVEQIDRLSRLKTEDWEKLKTIINQKNIRIVSLDLPSSFALMKNSDEFTARILSAINAMMMDFLAAFARKNYEERRKMQAQGVEKAKREGKYKGRREDKELHSRILELLIDGRSYNFIEKTIGCSRHTISKVNKRRKASPEAEATG